MRRRAEVKPSLVVCVKAVNLADPVPGSVTEKCVDCHEDVWISKATAESAGDAPPICMECMAARLRA